MIILNPDAEEDQRQEMLERVQRLIRDAGGTIEHVNDWGRRKITFPMQKQADGQYVVITCNGAPDSLAEVERILSINRATVLRSMFVRLSTREAEHAMANGAPVPVDTAPEGDSRPQRGRGGARGGRRPR